MEVKGKYGSAIIYTDEVENEAISQIINLLNQPMAEDAHVRIMPDCHAGAGCVIGYTAKLTGKIVPNLIGVDIGCGVLAYKLGKRSEIGEKFDKLDKFIRTNIPSGRNTHGDAPVVDSDFERVEKSIRANHLKDEIKEICKRTNQDFNYVWSSLGTLGGGNHFIEVDKDDEDNFWLIIHSGSRNFGLKVAKYHQEVAVNSILGISKEDFDKKVVEIKATKKGKGIEVAINNLRKSLKKQGKATGLEYLEGDNAQKYLDDMKIAQYYAQVNRRLMAETIVTFFYKLDPSKLEQIESVHNYISFDDHIVRKGSISAHRGEKVIIPLSMADGVIIGTGKGNMAWNFSAPHGAGRKMSRSKAKATIDLGDFQKIMKSRGIWTSSVGKDTLDEAPQAYKKAEHIIEYLKDTVDIKVHMKPVYNYKAAE
jgi:RNA-splicing ligase RtcB